MCVRVGGCVGVCEGGWVCVRVGGCVSVYEYPHTSHAQSHM